MTEPLEGLRVLDFTHGVAGPYCTMVLGDLGCDIIKIEKPGRGDPTRYMNVSDRFTSDIPNTGGDYFLAINRNKRSVAVDLSVPAGRDLCIDLARRCDVVVQNFRPGVMARLGLDYEALNRVNPRILYANISGYGGTGPLAKAPGMDVAVQARSGVMRITGPVDGDEPVRPGSSIADFGGGIYLSTAILAALLRRERIGRGQEVSVSLLDATTSMLINYSVAVLDGGAQLGPMGSGHPQIVPYQAFQTSDGWVVIAAGTNKIYRTLCQLIDRRDLSEDPRFRTNPDRVRNRKILLAELNPVICRRSTAEWLQDLEAADIPCAPVNDLATAFHERAEHAPHMVVKIPHPTLGSLHQLGIPFRFSADQGSIRRPPPCLGEHTYEVLTSVLGMNRDEIASLDRQNAIGLSASAGTAKS